MLPDAAAEAGGGNVNALLVAQGISSVAVGGASHRYFAALVVDDSVAGFMAAKVEDDVFVGRRVAREVFSYLRPSVRTQQSRGTLLDALEAWAKSNKADVVEYLVVGDESVDNGMPAAAERGYARAAIVLAKTVRS
ncbi:hypothetical protein [Paraburkholderia sp. UCT70]|uniref:hypothetical protein n=1 Tax=Paraburkholderia sp. UCT70 TaxID=2991068 RepID=UPI003D2406B3